MFIDVSCTDFYIQIPRSHEHPLSSDSRSMRLVANIQHNLVKWKLAGMRADIARKMLTANALELPIIVVLTPG
jgi:hypothetical protein